MRLIDADDLESVTIWVDGSGFIEVYRASEIDNAPTIDIEERLNDAYAHGWSDAEAKYHNAVEVVHGEWIHDPQIGWGETWVCSICGEKTTSSIMGEPRYKWCPMCGARMKGADDEQHTYGYSKQLL